MKKYTIKSVFFLLLLLLPGVFLVFPFVRAEEEPIGNDYPIVFISGAGGFTEDELFGLNYWGGANSILDALRAEGYEVYELKVGPISSVWDRGIESFYDLKGGEIDYGLAHSEEHNHKQKTRTLEGKYPEWGEIAADGTRNKVHIIGHSMGGQTARALVEFLGMNDPSQGDSKLFNEDLSDWVASVTSIAACHDGTTISPIAKYLLNKVLGQLTGVDLPYDIFLMPLAAIIGTLTGENPIYDLMLDQFSLAPEENEDVFEWLLRAIVSELKWLDYKDFALWDASPQGAAELNKWMTADSETYYFSYSTSVTRKLPLVSYHIPWSLMTPILYPLSAMIGFWDKNDGPINIHKGWYENDGVVNTISMNGPKLSSSDRIVAFDSNNIQAGVWNDMGKVKVDHMQVIGWLQNWEQTKGFYLNHASLLAGLPGEKPGTFAVEEELETVVEDIADDIEIINAIEPTINETDNPYTDPATYENGTVTPEDIDSDMDGMTNDWEERYDLDTTDPFDASEDPDLDGLTNEQEYMYWTSPIKSDTDSDGINDADEVNNGLNPRKADSEIDYDNDYLTNIEEIRHGTNPWEADTDGDGFDDEEEISMHSNPLDANSVPVYFYGPSRSPDSVLFTYMLPFIILACISVAVLSLFVIGMQNTERSARLKESFRHAGMKLSTARMRAQDSIKNAIHGRREKKQRFQKGLKEVEEDTE